MSDGPDTATVLLTMSQAAEQLGICKRTLLGHVMRGSIKYISVGLGTKNKKRLFHPDDIQAFIDAQRTTEWVMPVETRAAGRRKATQPTGPGSTVDEFLATLDERAKARRRQTKVQHTRPQSEPRDLQAEREARVAAGHWKPKAGRRHQQPAEPEGFLAKHAARVAAERAESEKRNGWGPGTLERRAQKQEARRRAESGSGRLGK